MDYNSVGTCLLNDNDGATMKRIERDRRYTDDIVGEVFDQWIRLEYQAGEENSNTWRTLVKCLRSVQINALADEIDRVLQFCADNPGKNCQHKKTRSHEYPRMISLHFTFMFTCAIISGILTVCIYLHCLWKRGMTLYMT